MRIEIDQGKQDHTMIFILVHSVSRATSSPLHNNAKTSTKITKFTYKYTSKIQSWTLQDCLYPYAEPYHKRYTTLVPNREPYCNVLCKLYRKNEITHNFNTNYAQIPYSSTILPKDVW